MATDSWPSVGEGGFTPDDFVLSNGAPDGIIEDYTGHSFDLARISSTNICRIGTTTNSLARLQGFTLKVPSTFEDLTCPPVSSGTVTYSIAICYDPALNVEDPVTGASPVQGALRLGIYTGALDTTGGKVYLLLYQFTRAAGQALSDVTVVDYRRWCGAPGLVIWPTSTPNPPTGVFDYPRGTVRLDTTLNRYLVREMDMSLGTPALAWLEIGVTVPVAFPLQSGFVGSGSNTPPAYYFTPGGRVHFRGTVARTNASTNLNAGDTKIGTMPSFARPPDTVRHCIYGKNAAGGHIALPTKVDPDGTVWVYDPPGSANVSWVDISAIEYTIRG